MFEQLYEWITVQLNTNDVFAGLVGGSVLISLLYLLRDVPMRLWRALRSYYTTTLTLRSDDHGFFYIDMWLAEREYTKRARRLKLSVTHNADKDEWEWRTAPGYGWHVFMHKGSLFIVNRDEPEVPGSGGNKRNALVERVRIATVGRRHDAINGLIAEAKALLDSRRGVTVQVWIGSYWRANRNREMRPLDTVILPQAQIDHLKGDIERFISRRGWYVERGIPYRRGFMFAGPPGVGKTSLAMALAGHFRREIYVLNLGSLKSDNALIEAMSEVGSDAVLLLEDIDAVQAAGTRAAEGAAEGMGDGDTSTISTSALLNTIDGAMATEGRVLIMTSNHPDKIDPALLRPGRVDTYVTILPLEAGDAARMFLRFFPGQNFLAERIAREMVGALPAATVQNFCIVSDEAPQHAAQAIIDAGREQEAA